MLTLAAFSVHSRAHYDYEDDNVYITIEFIGSCDGNGWAAEINGEAEIEYRQGFDTPSCALAWVNEHLTVPH
jgi:hypothetical protein